MEKGEASRRMSARDQLPMMTDTYNEPIFASAHAALVFAFNFCTEQYAPSVMAKLIRGGPVGSGKGLVGMDGAGQAGMILAEVQSLGMRTIDGWPNEGFVAELAPHFLAARFAPHTTPCGCRAPCCTGHRPAAAFMTGINWITDAAREQLDGHQLNYALRRGLVLRFFGERENMSELATRAGVSRDMASQHNAKLLPWLKHEEGRAMHAAIVRLKEKGFVE